MHLLLTGINHKRAGVEAREQFSLDGRETEDAIARLIALDDVEEVLIFSTCNRTEILCRFRYGLTAVSELERRIWQEIESLKGVDGFNRDQFFELRNDNAVRHIYRLAAGLESMIIGETNVFGQVKSAYHVSVRCNSTGSFLNKLMHCCFRVAKQVRSRTAISTGPTSVSAAAALLALKELSEKTEPTVLIIGAGEMAETAVKYLADHDASVTVINRSHDKAAELAREHDVSDRPWAELALAVQENDVIITATAAPHAILDGTMLSNAGDTTVIDIGMPRNVDDSVNDLENVRYFCIDDLRSAVQETIKTRHKELAVAEKMIDGEVDAFAKWYRSLSVEPTIKELLATFEGLRRSEVELISGSFDEKQQAAVEKMSRRLINKLLHKPISHLKSAPKGHVDNSEYWVGIVRELFDLTGSGDDQ